MSRNLSAITVVLLLAGCKQNGPSPHEAAVPPAAIEANTANKSDVPDTDVAKQTDGNKKTAQSEKGTAMKVATWKRERLPSEGASGALASMTGKLLVQNSCVVVALDNGQLLQPVFPSDSVSWDAEKQTLVFNGNPYQAGASITLGGGGVPNDASFRAQKGNNIPKCPKAKLFVVS